LSANIDPQVEPQRFREVLGHLPTGVTVVTAHHPSGPVAMLCDGWLPQDPCSSPGPHPRIGRAPAVAGPSTRKRCGLRAETPTR
jgi:hypothetical protein